MALERRRLTAQQGIALAVLVAITIPLALGASRTQVRNSLASWFVAGDPAFEEYKNFQQEFGSDEVILVALEFSGTVFQRDRLRLVLDLTQTLKDRPHIRSVLSLTTIHVLERDGGSLRVGELGQLLPFDTRDPSVIRERLCAEPLSYRSLVGGDERNQQLAGQLSILSA